MGAGQPHRLAIKCALESSATGNADAGWLDIKGSGRSRPPTACGRFPKIFAWLSRSRRLGRNYERLQETSEAVIYSAMSRIILQRIAA
ncbi:hypothetical protein E2C06_25505 [Dankookia rubra]|uniref:Transposase DDE domain-containing protein n=1 Tax=Dankookia rubra TaxID=1442381 RepID=A0A4R5Q9V4_9PROT|nr:hypothetical protein E2C06_25505 [Dankookia rubra]